MRTNLRTIWKNVGLMGTGIVYGTIPDLSHRITQLRPTAGPNSSDPYNNTLNALWNRLFGGDRLFPNGVVFTIFGMLAALIIINAGMRYVDAGGDPERAKKAKAILTNAVVAIILLVGTYAVLRVIILILRSLAGG